MSTSSLHFLPPLRPSAAFAALGIALLATLPAPARATVLDFGHSADTPFLGCVSATGACSTFKHLADSYGDIDGVLDVSTHGADGQTLSWWNTGYNELYGVAFNNVASRAAPAWVDLVPLQAGSAVTLTHFDLGGYYQSRRDKVVVQVFALGNDTPLFSYTGSIGSTGSGSNPGLHTGFDLALSSFTGLRIQWADPAVAANTGIDNITFSVGAPVPEPGSHTLLLCGLMTLWPLLRRRTRR